jgi:hypothetical protein
MRRYVLSCEIPPHKDTNTSHLAKDKIHCRHWIHCVVAAWNNMSIYISNDFKIRWLHELNVGGWNHDIHIFCHPWPSFSFCPLVIRSFERTNTTHVSICGVTRRTHVQSHECHHCPL